MNGSIVLCFFFTSHWTTYLRMKPFTFSYTLHLLPHTVPPTRFLPHHSHSHSFNLCRPFNFSLAICEYWQNGRWTSWSFLFLCFFFCLYEGFSFWSFGRSIHFLVMWISYLCVYVCLCIRKHVYIALLEVVFLYQCTTTISACILFVLIIILSSRRAFKTFCYDVLKIN